MRRGREADRMDKKNRQMEREERKRTGRCEERDDEDARRMKG